MNSQQLLEIIAFNSETCNTTNLLRLYHNGTIGVNSCYGPDACCDIGDEVQFINTSSCTADTTGKTHMCKGFSGVGIGRNSCNGNYSCAFASPNITISDNSCQGNSACLQLEENMFVNEYACNADFACNQISTPSVWIGKCACNENENKCSQQDDTNLNISNCLKCVNSENNCPSDFCSICF
jgi:hypothetical protein